MNETAKNLTAIAQSLIACYFVARMVQWIKKGFRATRLTLWAGLITSCAFTLQSSVAPAHRVIHTGDLFVNGAPLIDYTSGGSGIAWTATLDEALKLDFDRVIPGHGPIMKRADLIAWKTSFEKVRERITKLKRDGKDVKEAAAQLKMDDLPGWSGPSRFWSERSFPGLYQELAK